ncbi:hypothetical protein [Alloactinosynnema sp. L-07]|uniref:hypothetical protein n=1 Tax=Alloactinosynnema sp. L-07 TaxID=1653480 RepID=UPI00065EF5BF|nr:hypothetical protein [Alloactinosynnema sp. L-07]CRK59100.1 hypothetical protein [Alloactinosynnema sp. L-07]
MRTAELIDSLTETRDGGIDPVHHVTDRAKLAVLVTDMDEHGWVGPPLLVDGEQALTGAHRLVAARETFTPMPRVDIGELCDALGLKWAELRHPDGDIDANLDIAAEHLPTEIADYLGVQN